MSMCFIKNLKTAHQNHAAGYQNDAKKALPIDVVNRHAEQTKMVNDDCDKHLTRNYQTKCQGNAQTGYQKNNRCDVKSTQNAAHPSN